MEKSNVENNDFDFDAKHETSSPRKIELNSY